MSKPQYSAIIEAIDPFKMAQTSMSNTYKVFCNLHMPWMCIWIVLTTLTTARIVKTFGIQNSGCLLRSKPQSETQLVLEAISHSKWLPHQYQAHIRCLTTFMCCGCACG